MLIVSIITVFGGMFIAEASVRTAFTSLVAIVLIILCFLNTEIGLYILVIAMLLGPQFGVESGSSGLAAARGRALTLRLDDFLLLVIGISWFAKSAIMKDVGLFLKTPLNRPIAWYFIICLVATVYGIMMGRVKAAPGFFFLLKYFEYFIVYFMAVNHLKEKKQMERFVLTILIVCFIVCIIGIMQIPSGVRVSAPFEGPEGEPNTLGGYLDLILALVLGLLLTGGLQRYKYLLYLLIVFILITLAATLSRSSWLSLVPMMLAFLYFSRKKMMIILPLLLIIIAGPFILPKAVTQRALYTFSQPKEYGQLRVGNLKIDTSTSARLQTWKTVLFKDFMRNAVLGYGVTGYTFIDAQYPRVLVETGVLGLATFTMLLVALFRNGLYAYRHTADPLFSGISLGYIAGFFALLVHGIGANTFIIVRIMEPFWFMTAMVIMIPRIEAAEANAASPSEVKLAGKSRPSIRTGAAPIPGSGGGEKP